MYFVFWCFKKHVFFCLKFVFLSLICFADHVLVDFWWKWLGLAPLVFFVFLILYMAFTGFWVSLARAKRQRKLRTSYPFFDVSSAMFSILWESLPKLKDKEKRVPEVI